MDRLTAGEKIFNVFNIIILVLLSFITIYPFWYIIVIALHDSSVMSYYQVYFWPKVFTLNNFRIVFVNSELARGLFISALRTVSGSLLSVACGCAMAYALSKRHLMGRKTILTMITVTMFFSGGLIPSYLLYKSLDILNKFWIYILPGLLNVWYIFIMKTHFQGLPESIEESARIDGANDIRIFLSLVMPMSLPLVATILLFCGVTQWNDWTTAQLFVSNQKLWPIQTLMVKMITQMEASTLINQSLNNDLISKQPALESIKMASIAVATAPILLSYPFLQKYFIKGIMVGSIKG
jgi:putative aldouronate transport system permease protein